MTLFPEWTYGRWLLVMLVGLVIAFIGKAIFGQWGIFPGAVIGAWASGGAYIERISGFPNSKR